MNLILSIGVFFDDIVIRCDTKTGIVGNDDFTILDFDRVFQQVSLDIIGLENFLNEEIQDGGVDVTLIAVVTGPWGLCGAKLTRSASAMAVIFFASVEPPVFMMSG